MKYTNTLIFTLFSITLFAQYPEEDLGLYLPFGDLIEDLGAADYGIRVEGNPFVAEGIVGTATFFDGVDDCLLIPGFDNTGTMQESFTINAWIKPMSIYDDRWLILLTHNTPSKHKTPFSILYNHRYGSAPYVRFTGAKASKWTSKILPASRQKIKVGAWNFITWRFDRGVVEVFLDAKPVGRINLGETSLLAGKGLLEIGRDSPGRTEYFHGAIDELSFFESAIDDEEIRNIYELGLAGIPLKKKPEGQAPEVPVVDLTKVTIYPNPATTTINVLPREDHTLRLFDGQGRMVREAQGPNMEIEGLASGIYYLKIDDLKLKKVIVQSRIVYP